MCDQNGLPALQAHASMQHGHLLPSTELPDPNTLGVPPATKRPASPRHSLCDQNGLPTLPAQPALPLLPSMNLPDPNSIGVPPPENLPFPGTAIVEARFETSTNSFLRTWRSHRALSQMI